MQQGLEGNSNLGISFGHRQIAFCICFLFLPCNPALRSLHCLCWWVQQRQGGCVCACVCKCAFIYMYFQVSTATSLALSHEVNPGGQEHQFWLKEGYLGQTSAVCVNVDAAEWELLQAECAERLAL